MATRGRILAVFCLTLFSLPGIERTRTRSGAEPLLTQIVFQEMEPNNQVSQAQGVLIPATVSGSISSSEQGEIRAPSRLGTDLEDLYSLQTSTDGRLELSLTADNTTFMFVSLLMLDRDGMANVLQTRGTNGSQSVQFSLGVSAGAYLVGIGIGEFQTDRTYSLQITGSEGLIADSTPPTIKLKAPNGGERITSGSMFTIEWASDDTFRVARELEPNDSADEAMSIPSPVRVFGQAAQTDDGPVVIDLGDISDVVEDIYKISSPLGVETTISLSFSDQTSDLDLYLFEVRRDGIRVLDESAHPGPREETLRFRPSENIFVGVSAFEGSSGYTLEAINAQAPAIEGGGVIVSYDILLSTDGGMTYTSPIERQVGPGSRQSFDWTILSRFSAAQARIRVLARDASGNVAFDDSNGDFAVMP